MRAAQSLIAACYSKACAPPPTGKGGSTKGGSGSARSGSRAWKDWMWGYSHQHSTGITTHAARIMGIDDSKGETDRRYQVRAEGVLDAIRDSKPTKLVRQHATARAMIPADARVGSVVTLPPVATAPHDPEYPDYGWATKNMKPKDNGKVTILVFPAGTARTARYMDGRRSDEEEITAGKFEIVSIDRATSGWRASPQFDYDKQDWHYFPTTYYTLRQTHVFDRRTGTYVSVDAPQAPSAVVAACYSAACAPPSAGGTGGSLPGARKMASVATMAKVIKATAGRYFTYRSDESLLEDQIMVLRATGAASRKPHVVSAEKFESMVADNPDAAIFRVGMPAYHGAIRNAEEIPLLKGGTAYGEGLYFAGGPGAEHHVQAYVESPRYETLRAVVDYSSIAEVPFLLRVGSAARQILAGDSPHEDAPTLEAAGRLAQAFRKSGVASSKPAFYQQDRLGEWNDRYPTLPHSQLNVDSDAMYEPSLIAPLLGFKGFRIDRSALAFPPADPQVDYVVILDRSALTMPG